MQSLRRGAGSPRVTCGLLALFVLALPLPSLVGCDADRSARAVQEADERFQFIRASRFLLRFDTRDGKLWFTNHTGAGGWSPLGESAAAADTAAKPGRYRIFTLEPERRTSGEARQKALRIEGDTGRTWTIELVDRAQWIEVGEPTPSEPGAPSGTAGAPAAAPTPPAASAPVAPVSPVAPPVAPVVPLVGEEPKTADDLGVVSSDKIAADPEGAAEFAENLVQALEKQGMPPDIQAWSARQLGQFPKDVAVPPLLDALQSAHPVVVIAAIRSLRDVGDPSTIPHILQLRDHPDPSVRAEVQEIVRVVD